MNFQLSEFIRESGLKLLAIMPLKHLERRVILYLLHSLGSGLEYVITNLEELSSLLDADSKDLSDAVQELQIRNMISLRYKYNNKVDLDRQSFRLGLQAQTKRWVYPGEKTKSSKDALVFPFRRESGAALQVVKDEVDQKKSRQDVVVEILAKFKGDRSLDHEEMEKSREVAEVLLETHPAPQIFLMLDHFGDRIRSLSYLASSWQHYLDQFEYESQSISIIDAKQKQLEVQKKIRDQVQNLLDRSDALQLKEEERTVLKVLLKHRHPRRQLYWAYTVRDRYPNLADFFERMKPMMLSVTNAGSWVKKPDDV